MRRDDIDLSGAWNGSYSYSDWPEPVTFVALLIDVGSRLSGSIHTVTYDGTLNGDATEITGHWHVGGGSGPFVMIRAGAAEEAELRKTLEPVDAC